MTTKKERVQEEAKKFLLETVGLKPGDTIYTQLRHVSRSGMYRCIALYVIRDNEPWDISWNCATLLEGFDERHYGCKASGCGMDMGFALVSNLAWKLFGRNWQCTGDNCPSNDHVNNWKGPRGAGVLHSEGGYALRQKWM